jgi:hypothetical protein
MPEFFTVWLKSLTDEQAEKMWLWLDGGDILEAIDVVCESHPRMVAADRVKGGS